MAIALGHTWGRKLCEILGIDPSKVRRVTLDAQCDAACTVTVERLLTKEEGEALLEAAEELPEPLIVEGMPKMLPSRVNPTSLPLPEKEQPRGVLTSGGFLNLNMAAIAALDKGEMVPVETADGSPFGTALPNGGVRVCEGMIEELAETWRDRKPLL